MSNLKLTFVVLNWLDSILCIGSATKMVKSLSLLKCNRIMRKWYEMFSTNSAFFVEITYYNCECVVLYHGRERVHTLKINNVKKFYLEAIFKYAALGQGKDECNTSIWGRGYEMLCKITK